MDATYHCACCGEENEVWLDPEAGSRQQLVEDCAVCCRPMVITATWNAWREGHDIEVYQEDRGS
jgi:hypothetical protein